MANSNFKNYYHAAIVGTLLTVVLGICLHTADAIGACYGTLGNNLPPPREVIALCNRHNIRSIRIYNPNPSILEALQGNRNISVIVGLANEDIINIAKYHILAKTWVQNNILRYKYVNFRYIAVGNEISPLDSASAGIAPSVVRAMQNVYNALIEFGLGQRVKVSTALSMGVIGQSYPPSAGAFRPEIMSSYMIPIVNFLARTRAPFLMNMYPYFSYVSDQRDISLNYALFTSPGPVVRDGPYQYQNLFDAMLDAVYVALSKAGGANVEIVVSETGWPSAGGVATTLENARIYNSNLIRSVQRGTPRKPRKPIETYIFDLIDENLKSPELERHWGLFLANGQPKYPL